MTHTRMGTLAFATMSVLTACLCAGCGVLVATSKRVSYSPPHRFEMGNARAVVHVLADYSDFIIPLTIYRGSHGPPYSVVVCVRTKDDIGELPEKVLIRSAAFVTDEGARHEVILRGAEPIEMPLEVFSTSPEHSWRAYRELPLPDGFHPKTVPKWRLEMTLLLRQNGRETVKTLSLDFEAHIESSCEFFSWLLV